MTFYQSPNAGGDAPDTSSTDRRETLIEALRWMTVYESANAATPRNRLQRVVKRNGDLLTNSGALMATSVLTSLLGFVYWWVAARSFSADAVGAASAAISAMTLIGTLGMFGMGTLLISELPKAKDRQWSLISTCVLVAAGVSTAGGFIYVCLALFAVPGLRGSLGSPLGIVLLVVAMSLNAAMLVFDEGLVGLLLGHLQLLRNAYFAVGKLVAVGILAALPVVVTGTEVLATWVAGILLSIPLLWLSLRARGIGPIRPRRSALRGLGRHTLDHNLLNVALFLPRISLPLVVTSVVSTRANAAFYTAWMVMSFLAMIPGSIATTLFAVAGGDAAALRARVRVGLVIALGIGVPVSTAIAILAHPIMSVFGDEYAASASKVLSILALTYVVGVVRQFYVAISRVRRRARQASVFAVAVGVMELGAAWIGGRQGGLSGLVTWLAGAFVVEGVLMAPAVLRVALARAGRLAGAPVPPAEPPPADVAGAEPDAGQESVPSPDHDVRSHSGRRRSSRKPSGTPVAPPGRPPVIPRPRTGEPAVAARPRADETMVIPLRRADETMVIPLRRADETMVIEVQRADETMVFERVAADEPAAGELAADEVAVDGTVATPWPPGRHRGGRPADETMVLERVPGDDVAAARTVATPWPPRQRRTGERPADETMVMRRLPGAQGPAIPRPRTGEPAQTPPRVL